MRTAAGALVARAADCGATVAVAESFTGGMVSQALVAIPGASRVFRGGVTAYQIPVKASVMGISSNLISDEGVVSVPVAQEMARSAQRVFSADLGIGTTGVAGPGPDGTVAAGTIILAAAYRDLVWVRTWRLGGFRSEIRGAGTGLALALSRELLTHASHTGSSGTNSR